MIDWSDCTPLTRKEFDDFIAPAIPFLKQMEYKNGWDFFVNDMSTQWFCQRFILEASELDKHEDYQEHNTKVKDMDAIYFLLMDADWSKEDAALRSDKSLEIWKLVLDKVNAVADNVF